MARVAPKRVAIALVWFAGAGCNAVFGLEDVRLREDGGGAAGAGSGGGGAGAGAGESSGGVAGAAAGGSSGVAGAPSGGSGGSAAGGSAGSGGSGGAPVETLLDMSESHVCVARSGSVKCWGKNTEGQLDGSASLEMIGDQPGEMGTALGAVELYGAKVAGLAVADRHTCALTEQASVRCWGSEYNGVLGLGSQKIDVPLGTNAAVEAIDARGFFTCAQLISGAVKCWGANAKFQLGQAHSETIGDGGGEMGDALLPLDFGTNASVLDVSTGYDFACVRSSVGQSPHARCWGSNDQGQLGFGPTSPSVSLANASSILTSQPLLAIATGRWHACAIHADETMSCWGVNYYGELGLGVGLSNSPTPSSVVLGDHKAKAVALGSSHTCAIVERVGEDRSIKCWGHNDLGQRGVDTKTNVGKAIGGLGNALEAVKLPDGFVPQQVAAAGKTSCAVSEAGDVLCWGSNEFGLLGQGKADASIGDSAGSMAELTPIDLGWQ
jgi:alpha-tubulin suppressor-like RCC1 family protein